MSDRCGDVGHAVALRYKLSLRDLVEMFAVRGYEFTHETVREWEARFAPLLSAQLKGLFYVMRDALFERSFDCHRQCF